MISVFKLLKMKKSILTSLTVLWHIITGWISVLLFIILKYYSFTFRWTVPMCAIGGPFCRMRCTRTSRTLCGFCLSLGIESLLFEYQKNLHRVIVKSNIPIFIIWRPTLPHQGWPNCHLRREERNTDGNCAWSGKRRIADHLCRVHWDSRQH